ncbi:MAG: ExbD/TolR family protein [Myxococcota bacterium]
MASLSKAQHQPRPFMNVTPLVDVVLVLLIIFMIVVPQMEKGAQVELPAIFNVDEDAKSKTDPFILAIEADGATFFEQERLSREAIETRLRKANREEPHRRLVLRADRRARYEWARKAFTMAQGIGFPGISLRVSEKGHSTAD